MSLYHNFYDSKSNIKKKAGPLMSFENEMMIRKKEGDMFVKSVNKTLYKTSSKSKIVC